jgi:hypothetical protein
VDAVSAASCARQADVSFLVKKLAAVEQQLLTSKAAALLHAGSALQLPPSQSLSSILALKAAEAEAAAPRREVASAHADDAAASQTMLLQQVLPLLQSSCESFAALQAKISQVGLSPQVISRRLVVTPFCTVAAGRGRQRGRGCARRSVGSVNDDAA